jgi:hypothetical protein
MKYFLMLLGLVSGLLCSAQRESLRVSGKISTYEEGKTLRKSQVTMEVKSGRGTKTVLAKNGHYKLKIPYDQVVLLIFAADGYVTKKIEVDTRNVPENRKRFERFKIDADLFKDIPGFDFKVMHEPISKAAFKYTTGTFGWDTDYYRERLKQIDAARAKALEGQQGK